MRCIQIQEHTRFSIIALKSSRVRIHLKDGAERVGVGVIDTEGLLVIFHRSACVSHAVAMKLYADQQQTIVQKRMLEACRRSHTKVQNRCSVGRLKAMGACDLKSATVAPHSTYLPQHEGAGREQSSVCIRARVRSETPKCPIKDNVSNGNMKSELMG